MAGTGGRAPADLIAALRREPWRFDFFQAVRLLEAELRRSRLASDREGAAAAGARPADLVAEAVRFRASLDLAYPAAPIAALDVPSPPAEAIGKAGDVGVPGDPRPALTLTFLGLIGPAGVLPLVYTDLAARLRRERKTAMADFLDLFEDRLVRLFYEAWARYRLPIAAERAAGGTADPLRRILAALVGLATPGLAGRLAVADAAVLFFAGHFARRQPSPVALAAILADYFALDVAVESFRGRWLPIPAAETTRLPGPGRPFGRNCRLGITSVAGERLWTGGQAFRIRLGPLRYRRFLAFLPGAADRKRLADLVRLLVGPEYAFDIQLVLRADEVPALRLTGEGDGAPRLAWTTWLAADRPRRADADDVVVAAPA